MLWKAAAVVAAPVTVEVALDQEQFLRDESLPLEVRITNRSGQDLLLGQTPDWLACFIERKDGGFVPQSVPLPAIESFTLESSLVAKRRLDLMPYFYLGDPGRYVLTVRVKLPQWDQEIFSKPKTFDITRGTRIWEQDFGVPAVSGLPEVRRYALIQANNFKELMLYLRLTDATDTKVFRMVALGPLVSFSRPEAQLDRNGNLHALFQTGARAFFYYLISPQGNVLMRQTHEYAASRPVLASNAEGRIFVEGGQRRPAATDLPAPAPPAPVATPGPPRP